MQMEAGTGVKASVIGRTSYEKAFSHIPLRKTRDLVWVDVLKMKGGFTAKVQYEDQSADLTVCVVDGQFPALFVLPRMSKLRWDFNRLIPCILQVNENPLPPNKSTVVSELKRTYPHVFQKIPGTILNHEVNLQLEAPYQCSVVQG